MEEPLSINIFDWLKGARDAIHGSRQSLTDAAWKELGSTISSFLLDGKPAYAGLVASSGPIGQRRYTEWLFESVKSIIRQANQIDEITKDLGGPIPLRQEIADEFALIIDRLFCDLILLSAKLVRKTIFPDETTSGKRDVPRLADVLPNMDWEARFDNQLRNHLNECVYVLLIHLGSRKRKWLVVLHPFREERMETYEPGDCDQPSCEIDLDAHRLAGKMLWFQFASASAPDELCDTLKFTYDLSKYAGDRSLLSSLEDFFGRIQGSPGSDARHDFICFATHAHSLTIQQNVDELLRLLSGIVALFRSLDQHSWFCHLATLRTKERELRISFGDAERVEGIAISGAAALEVEPIAVAPSSGGLGPLVISLDCGASIVPIDQEELSAINRQITANPFADLILRAIAFGGRLESGIGQLQKACHFWSRGELQRQSISGQHYSVWCISDAFLAYCTVAEILAGAKDNVTELMSSRLASVLADAPEKRAEIYRQIKSLYGKRSRYVHGGEAVIRYDDVLQVREVVRKSLIYAVFWFAERLGRRIAEVCQEKNDLRITFEQTIWPVIKSSDLGTFQEHCDEVRFGMPRISVQAPTEDEGLPEAD